MLSLEIKKDIGLNWVKPIWNLPCIKSINIQSFSGLYFHAFNLNALYLSIFSPNPERQRPEKLQIRILSTQSFRYWNYLFQTRKYNKNGLYWLQWSNFQVLGLWKLLFICWSGFQVFCKKFQIFTWCFYKNHCLWLPQLFH